MMYGKQLLQKERGMFINEKLAGVLRVVAIFEVCKALLVLFSAGALVVLIHQHIQISAEQLVVHLHLNPAHHFPKKFIALAGTLTESRMRILLIFALLYSSIRILEAYGLWFAQRWAEWVALLSAGIYLPFELYELTKGFTWFKVILLSINIVVVLYMAVMLAPEKKEIKT